MASGGFHGGSSHSGSFHSSGGGGFSGGGGYSGGSSHYSSGGHYYGGGGGSGAGSAWLIFAWGPLIMWMLAAYNQSVLWGFNYLNIFVFWVSGIVFYIVGKQSERTAVTQEIKHDCRHRVLGCVWNGSYASSLSGTDKKSWAGAYGYYRIVFDDREFGEDNVLKVREVIDRTPKIIWMSYKVWVFIGVLAFFSSVFFYELVIPVFENAIMSDEAFAFFDNLTFYFPSILCALCAAAALITMWIKDGLLYKCAVRIVQENKAAEMRIRTETSIADRLSKKWYYNICPNCGAEAGLSGRFCNKCGSSLEMNSFNGNSYSGFHRISEGNKEK